MLRDRAEHLRQLAASIEQSLVVRFGPTIGAEPDVPGWGGTRARLCERMLERNLLQLHGAADDLRETAWRFHRRADVLERLVARQGAA